MASVWRATAHWENFIGSPGYTKLAFQDVTTAAAAQQAVNAMRTFFDALKTFLPSGLEINVSREMEEFDEVTGTLVGEVVAATPPATVTGVEVGPYAGGSGAFLAWKTGQIWQGRRVQGRTFIVPAANCYEPNGTLISTAQAVLQGAGDALIADPNSTFCIWAKQWSKPTTPNEKPVQIGGAAFQATSCIAHDTASQLRSRRA